LTHTHTLSDSPLGHLWDTHTHRHIYTRSPILLYVTYRTLTHTHRHSHTHTHTHTPTHTTPHRDTPLPTNILYFIFVFTNMLHFILYLWYPIQDIRTVTYTINIRITSIL